MCHQSVGLLQGAIERLGIPTISVTVRPEITAHANVSRACYVRFPTGNPMGEPHKAEQQRMILTAVLEQFVAIKESATIVELPFRWRRM
jgi:D-proline reductase (dithiol) PrdB